MADRAEEQAKAEEKLVEDIACVLGYSSQISLDELDGRLRGQKLRDVAIRVLAAKHSERRPIHYRAWFELLRDEGYVVAGKDPLATFLAQISRAPEVEAIGRRSGLYLLRSA